MLDQKNLSASCRRNARREPSKRPSPPIRMILVAFLPVLTCVFAAGGCAAPMKEAPPLTQTQTVKSFPPGATEESLTAGGVAVLEPPPGSGAEGMRDNLAFEVFQGLRLGFPKAKVRSRPDSDALLTQADLLADVRSFLKEYSLRRSIDWDLMSRAGEAEQTRYLFFSRIEHLEKKTDVRILYDGEDSAAGKVTVFASGPDVMPVSVAKEVRLYGELWDLRCRAVVWSGEGEAGLTEPAGNERLRMEDVFTAAGRILVGSLQQSLRPAGKGGSC
jgi:hypothetical protein